MNYENILFENAGGIARITLNRPDRLNSFTVAMHTELRDAIGRIKSDPGVRVLLLTGAGRGFCAGQDLADRGAVSAGDKPVDLGETVAAWWAPLVIGQRDIRAGRRPGHRHPVGQLHPVLLQARPDPGHRRHLGPAAIAGHCARDGAGHARR